MRAGGLMAMVTLLAISCNNPSPTVIGPSPSPSGNPSSSPSGSPTTSPAASSYGLLLTAQTLQMITPSGAVAATAKAAYPTRHLCGGGNVAGLQPPVSATADKVFYRDGDTQIRYLTPDGHSGDVTTVPGSGSKLSFFSVSPDDRRIAVLVEDFSHADRIDLTLYVEDLVGHTHHKVIYTNSSTRYVTGRTLWPMGWHQGLLVLGVFPTCTYSQVRLIPTEWHVADPTTGIRVAKIGSPCEPSYWPSPAGVVCIQRQKTPAYTFDWAAKKTNRLEICCDDNQSGLSPSGKSFFQTPRPGQGRPPTTFILTILGPSTFLQGHAACLWIDETHLLAPDAVIRYDPSATSSASPGPTSTPVRTGTPVPIGSPAPTPSPGSSGPATVIPLPAAGQCAGRFPGGL
jgi:hypothetical protein